ncbi:MAG: GGDEF domain-containing protein [Myxococcales bacterium]|nr:GGDEF domain-containing protein [Myxococcales bacterium]
MTASPSGFPRDCASVYSDWEKHKLAVAGLLRLSAVGLACSIVVLVLEAFFLRPRGTDFRVLLGPAIGVLASLAAYAHANRRGVDIERPMALATGLALVLAVAGGLGTTVGGFGAPYALGLWPVLMAWPLLMPGGLRRALLPLAGGMLLQLLALLIGSGGRMAAEDRSLAALLTFSGAIGVATAEVVESWRKRAAAASPHDWLTGALRPEDLSTRLKELCALRERDLAPFSLVMLDIDRFRDINADFGRAAGDEVLSALAEAVRGEIRGHDFFGRTGGDEFLLVLDQCEGEQALSLVERVRGRLSQAPVESGEKQVRVTFSAGIACANIGDNFTAPELIRSAERALKDGKEAARGRTALTRTEPELPLPIALASPREGKQGYLS